MLNSRISVSTIVCLSAVIFWGFTQLPTASGVSADIARGSSHQSSDSTGIRSTIHQPSLGAKIAQVETFQDEEEVEIARLSMSVAELIGAGRNRDAKPIAEEAVARALRHYGPSHPRTAIALNNLAQVNENLGQLGDAESLFKQALEIDERALGSTDINTVSIGSNLGQLYAAEGRFGDAEPLQRRAVEAYIRDRGESSVDTAQEMNNLGLTLSDEGRYSEAEPLLTSALATYQNNFGRFDPQLIAPLDNLGGLYQKEARYSEAEGTIDRALKLAQSQFGADDPRVATPIDDLASVFDDEGKDIEAERLYRRSLAILEKSLGPSHPNIAAALSNLALSYSRAGRLREAEPLLRQALNIDDAIFGADSSMEVPALLNLADVEDRLDHNSEAEALLRRAVSTSSKSLGTSHAMTTAATGNLAGILYKEGRLAEAETQARAALDVDSRVLGLDHPQTIKDDNNLATIVDAMGRAQEAKSLLVNALAGANLHLTPGSELEASIRENLGLHLFSEGNFIEAADQFQKGCAIRVERAGARAIYSRPTEVGTPTGNLISCSRSLAGTLFRLAETPGDKGSAEDRFSDAFLAAQHAGPDIVQHSVMVAAARVAAERTGVGDAIKRWQTLLSQEQALDRRIADLAIRPSQNQSLAIAALSAQRNAVDQEIQSVASTLRSRVPSFADFVMPKPATLRSLRSGSGQDVGLLRNNEALILLMPGTSYLKPPHQQEMPSLVFAITTTRFAAAAVPVAGASLEKLIDEVRASAEETSDSNNLHRSFDRKASNRLYQLLFGDPRIAEVVAQKPNWIVVPQWMFLRIPFAALVVEKPMEPDDESSAIRTTKWLGLERAISVLPSLSMLRTARGNSNDHPFGVNKPSIHDAAPADRFLGFGDPAFNQQGGECSEPSDVDLRQTAAAAEFYKDDHGNLEAIRSLPRLPGTCLELRSLASTFDAPRENVVLGLAASEATVREHPHLQTARILAFATHALIGGDFGSGTSEPALVLTPPEYVRDAENDGLLTASEIAQFRLNSDWVILSACNTAAASENGGEGLSGLARAFFYAGAQSLLVSQWRISDSAASYLTTHAAEYYVSGKTRSASLQHAMQDLASQDQNFGRPSVWAPFMLVGVD